MQSASSTVFRVYPEFRLMFMWMLCIFTEEVHDNMEWMEFEQLFEFWSSAEQLLVPLSLIRGNRHVARAFLEKAIS